MESLKDKLGKSIEPGCYIAYGHALGSCSALRIGMVLAVKTIEPQKYGYSYSNHRITVIGVDDDWTDRPPKLNNRVGTLMFPERTIVLNPRSVPKEYKDLLKKYKKSPR